jgi:hypothetical protein
MATVFTSTARNTSFDREASGHKFRLLLAWLAALTLIVSLSVYGYPYYKLGIGERPYSDLHSVLRPSGSIGLKLGMLGTAMYCVLFLFPLRKRWTWLAGLGKTRHWLDFHVLMGISAPIVITFHASFKLQGMVGIAYWIMVSVALSGFIGRYMYAQIPRSLNAVQLTMSEIQTQTEELAAKLSGQHLFAVEEIAPLLEVPTAAEVRRMSLGSVFWTMLRLDLARPIRVSRLRRRVIDRGERFTTLGGLLASRNAELESIVTGLRKHSWLRTKTAFLDRTQHVFHLWHVVHRPFSYSFALLVIVHIVLALSLGYF